MVQGPVNKLKDIKKILIINLGGIGDVLLSTPALKSLKKHFSNAQISMLIIPRVAEVVGHFAYIDNAYILHKDKIHVLRDLKTIYLLRKEYFDLAINMRTLVSKKSAEKMKLLLYAINPKVKAGRDTEGRGYFFDVKIPESDIGLRYEMEYDIEMAELLGAEVVDRDIDFSIDNESAVNVNSILEKSGILENDTLIGIHPGGKFSHRWPIENFSKLINMISNDKECKFVITGSKDETSLAKRLFRLTNIPLIDLVGKLNIKELGALLTRCSLFISNDTGIIHIAAILDTPLIAIFGPGYLSRYDPRNISEKAIVLYKKADCAPCNKEKCQDLRCLKMISPDEVLEVVWRLLGK